VTVFLALAGLAALGALFIPTLVREVNGFVQALPGYVDDITHRRGRLGFLESRYHVTQRVRDAVENGGTSRVLGLTGTAVAITKGIITAIVATVTIAFMTVFMLLEGPEWVERFYALLPDCSVGFIHSIVAGIILIVFFILYQQLENHVLQPVVYSRTVKLSPLAILISVLVGAQLAGVLGALAAIPVAGTIQVVLAAWLEQRRAGRKAPATI
jgi:predicted PurR-regulated permease PerM